MGQHRQDIHTAGIPVLCRSCEARHRGMCGVLGPDELTALARHTRKANHAPGDELIGESTETSSYANVMRGVVKLTKGLEDGRQQVVGLQFADFLGLTIESVSRQITKLKTEGVIHLEGLREVAVPNLERLRELAG